MRIVATDTTNTIVTAQLRGATMMAYIVLRHQMSIRIYETLRYVSIYKVVFFGMACTRFDTTTSETQVRRPATTELTLLSLVNPMNSEIHQLVDGQVLHTAGSQFGDVLGGHVVNAHGNQLIGFRV